MNMESIQNIKSFQKRGSFSKMEESLKMESSPKIDGSFPQKWRFPKNGGYPKKIGGSPKMEVFLKNRGFFKTWKVPKNIDGSFPHWVHSVPDVCLAIGGSFSKKKFKKKNRKID